MGLNTNQGVHVWRHKRDGSVLFKLDGTLYTYIPGQDRACLLGSAEESRYVLHMKEYSRCAIHDLEHNANQVLQDLVGRRYTFRSNYR